MSSVRVERIYLESFCQVDVGPSSIACDASLVVHRAQVEIGFGAALVQLHGYLEMFFGRSVHPHILVGVAGAVVVFGCVWAQLNGFEKIIQRRLPILQVHLQSRQSKVRLMHLGVQLQSSVKRDTAHLIVAQIVEAQAHVVVPARFFIISSYCGFIVFQAHSFVSDLL